MKSFLTPQIAAILVFLNLTTPTEAFFLDSRETNTMRLPLQSTTSTIPLLKRHTKHERPQHTTTLSSTNFPPKGGASSSPTKLDMIPTPLIFDNAPFLQSTNILLLSNLLGFVISLVTGSHLHLDLIGTGAFSIAALPSLLSSNVLRIKLSSGAMCVWGAKLAGFLFFRALKVNHDTRLDDTLSSVGGIAGFWFFSVVWGLICSLPQTLGTTSPDPGNPLFLTAGMTLFSLGFITETLADVQKWSFKQSNPGKICDVGLWSISQRPNYFGNLLVWSGILLMNAPSLLQNPTSLESAGGTSGIVARVWGARRAVAAALSPLFLWCLFSSQANGSLTNAIELAKAKYGDDANYEEYLKKVPLIVPGLFQWLRQLLPWKA